MATDGTAPPFAPTWAPALTCRRRDGSGVAVTLFTDVQVRAEYGDFRLGCDGQIHAAYLDGAHYVADEGRLIRYQPFALSHPAFPTATGDQGPKLPEPAEDALLGRLRRDLAALLEAAGSGELIVTGSCKPIEGGTGSSELASHLRSLSAVGLPPLHLPLKEVPVLAPPLAMRIATWWLASVRDAIGVNFARSPLRGANVRLVAAWSREKPLTRHQSEVLRAARRGWLKTMSADAAAPGLPFPARLELLSETVMRLRWDARTYLFTSDGRLLACRVGEGDFAVVEGRLCEVNTPVEDGIIPAPDPALPLAQRRAELARLIGYRADVSTRERIVKQAQADVSTLHAGTHAPDARAAGTMRRHRDYLETYETRDLVEGGGLAFLREWASGTESGLQLDDVGPPLEDLLLLNEDPVALWHPTREGSPEPHAAAIPRPSEPDRSVARGAVEMAPRRVPAGLLPLEHSATFLLNVGPIVEATDGAKLFPRIITIEKGESRFEARGDVYWFDENRRLGYCRCDGHDYCVRDGRLARVRRRSGDPFALSWQTPGPGSIGVFLGPAGETESEPDRTREMLLELRHVLAELGSWLEHGWIHGAGRRSTSVPHDQPLPVGWNLDYTIGEAETRRRAAAWTSAVLGESELGAPPWWVRFSNSEDLG